jgi:Ca2+-binding EF-hand superfamily protein
LPLSAKEKMKAWFENNVDSICQPSSYLPELEKLNEDGTKTVAVDKFINALVLNDDNKVMFADETNIEKYFKKFDKNIDKKIDEDEIMKIVGDEIYQLAFTEALRDPVSFATEMKKTDEMKSMISPSVDTSMDLSEFVKLLK